MNSSNRLSVNCSGNHTLEESCQYDYLWEVLSLKFNDQSGSQVEAAGKVIRDPTTTDTAHVNEALTVIDRWRRSHAYPLQVASGALKKRVHSVDEKGITSQRLKRLLSIQNKLRRHRTMSLATMQDIGGCRAVLETVDQVKAVAGQYPHLAKDYIQSPKPDGYRGIHAIETFEPTIDKHAVLKGRKTEIQLRTILQHAWATAVEIVDVTTSQELKAGRGSEEFRRFFALASSYIAWKENCPLVPGTPQNIDDLIGELQNSAQSLKIFSLLSGLTYSLKGVDAVLREFSSSADRRRKPATYVLMLDLDHRLVKRKAYYGEQLEEASDELLRLEKEHFGNPRFQVVQVKVDKLKSLRKMFPNYHLDAEVFLGLLAQVV